MFKFRNELNNAQGFSFGVLAVKNVRHVQADSRLKRLKQELEAEIRCKYARTARAELKALHPMDAYVTYFKRFGYSYHVLPQLESVARGKDIPDVLPLVEAMFMAEMKNMLLTAGHDLDRIIQPLCLKVSTGHESLLTLTGKEVMTIPGDVMVTDQEGVISSTLRGSDFRTAITEQTKNVVYTVYAPAGVERELIARHLSDIQSYVRIFSLEAETIVNTIC